MQYIEKCSVSQKTLIFAVKRAAELWKKTPQNALKLTIFRWKIKKISGEGAQPPPQTHPQWGGGHPLPTPHTPLRARTDNSVNILSDRKTVRKDDTEDFYGNTSNASGGGGWAFFCFLLSTKTISTNLAGCILKLLYRAHWAHVLELGQPTAVVNCCMEWRYTYIVCIFERFPGVTALRSAAPTTKDAGPMADPWMILAVIPSRSKACRKPAANLLKTGFSTFRLSSTRTNQRNCCGSRPVFRQRKSKAGRKGVANTHELVENLAANLVFDQVCSWLE